MALPLLKRGWCDVLDAAAATAARAAAAAATAWLAPPRLAKAAGLAKWH